MKIISAFKRVLNCSLRITTTYGGEIKYPYRITIYPGPLLQQPLVWESFDPQKAIKYLMRVRCQYSGHWIENSTTTLYEDSNRWDLIIRKEAMKVFLDDTRDTPEGWVRTYTVEETIQRLQTRLVQELSLDNDLGEGMTEGYRVLDWLEETVYFDSNFPLPVITVHSSNAARVEYMQRVIKNINHIRQQQMGDN